MFIIKTSTIVIDLQDVVLSVNILVFVPQKPSAPQLYGQEEDSQQTVKEPERQQVEAEPEPVR